MPTTERTPATADGPDAPDDTTSSPPADDRIFPVRLPRLGGEVLGVAVVSWVWAIIAYRLFEKSWRVPLHSQGDARLITNLVKNVADHGWWTTNPDVGVPVGQQLYDFPHGGETWQMVLIRAITVFTDDPGLVMNVYFFTGTGITAAAAYLALRHLRFSVGLALGAATALSWLPFRIGHGEYHLFRTTFWWVPLSIVILLWALHWRERFLRDPERAPTGGWRSTLVDTVRHNLRRRRVVAYLAMLVVLAGSETMTTAFTLTLLAITGVIAAIRRRDPGALVVHGLSIAAIGLVVAVLLSPTLRFVAAHGNNEQAGRRQVTEQEQFGMKISSVLLPDSSHRWSLLGRPEARIRATTPIPSEAGQSIGLLGAAGFLGAVVHSLTRGWGARRRDLRPPHDRAALRDDLGLLVVIGTLVATVSGIAILISLAGFSQVRVWNRMSLLLGFCSLAFALTWLETGWRLVRERVESTPARDRAWPRQAVGVVLAALLVGFVLWDGSNIQVDYGPSDAAWEADRDYVAAIDAATPDGTAVFQLPVTPFPEGGPVHQMHDYDHLRAFIHTEDARLVWSYGAMRGRPDGDWQLAVRDRLGEVAALPALLGAGFDGLWVDTFGYADGGVAVRAALDEATGVAPIVSADHRTLYYDLRPLRESLHDDGTTDRDLRQIARDELGLDLPD